MQEPRQALFQSAEQALEVTFRSGQRLAILVSWSLLIGLHVTAFLIGLFVVWWLKVNPDHVSAAMLGWLETKSAAVLGALGVSLMGVLGAYLAGVRWVWRKTFGQWLFQYLHQDVFP
jgi:hypothetical protein